MELEEGPAHLSISPSFSSYSSGSGSSSIAEIAARVVREIGQKSFENSGSDYCGDLCNGDSRESVEEVRSEGRSENGDHDDDDEFEFAVLCRESDASTSSANEIFFNGQIKPVYPVFNTKLLLDTRGDLESKNPKTKTKPAARRRSPLRKLMNEDKRKTTSQSSSEADDLGDIPSDTYCVWSPNAEKSSLGRSNKRNSTGSSNGWKLKDLLYNNNQSKSERDQPGNLSKVKEDRRSAIGVASSSGFASFPSHNARYGRNRAAKEAEKRKSYLPYRQHLVGCVVDVNATM